MRNVYHFLKTEFQLLVCLLTVLALLGVLTTAYAAEDGLQVLKQAETKMSSISFCAKCDLQSGLKTIVFQKGGAYGGFFIRKDYIFEAVGVLQTNEFLLNAGGYWNLVSNVALRLDFQKVDSQSPFFGICANGLDAAAESDYNLETERLHGRDVYVVTQTIQPTSPDSISSGNTIRNSIIIGKEDHLLYGFTSQRGGRELFHVDVTDFEVLSNLSDDFFGLPGNLTEIICSNNSQYAQATISALDGIMRSPTFKTASQNYKKERSIIRHFILVLMFIPTTAFVLYWLLRSKPESV